MTGSRKQWLKMPQTRSSIYLFIPSIIALVIAVVTVYSKLAQHQYNPVVFADIDGWFVYKLAQSLPSLQTPLDNAAYRAQRILLSALAAPFGPFVAWAIIGINITALVAGTYALSKLAEHYGATPFLGCMFGIWLGSLYVVHLDLTEVLAYALVLWGILFWEKGQLYMAGLWFGLAVLAKETALLYGLAFLLSSLRWSWGDRLGFGLLALGPGILWQLVLKVTFGRDGVSAAMASGQAGENMMPLRGLLVASTPNWTIQIGIILLPAIAATVWGIVWLCRRGLEPVGWALLLNGLFVMSLPPASTAYLVHSTRIALGMVVALAWAVGQTKRQLWTILMIELFLLPTTLFWPGLYL